MSFLVPKIDSKNAKEAWRAYRMVTRGAEEAVGILRRGDVLPEVKEQIFAWELKYKPQIVGLILQDPSHPCFQKAKRLSDEEKAAIAGFMQNFLDDFLAGHPEADIDFIHGEDSLRKLCRQPESIGVIMPEISKQSFFRDVTRLGVLPRKTFSMGEAHEKRFYMEARRI